MHFYPIKHYLPKALTPSTSCLMAENFVRCGLVFLLLLLGACNNTPSQAAGTGHFENQPLPSTISDSQSGHSSDVQSRKRPDHTPQYTPQMATNLQAKAEQDQTVAQVQWVELHAQRTPHPTLTTPQITAPPQDLIRNKHSVPVAHLDQHKLMELLRQQIAHGDREPATRAILLATLNLIDAQDQLDTAAITTLDTKEQKRVARYQKLIQSIFQATVVENLTIDKAWLVNRSKDFDGSSQIRILTTKLVKSVGGWGVYEEFPSNRFVAGRENPMLIYVEIDHFKTITSDNGIYQVKLEQEIELYTDHDGQMVWRQPPEQVTDASKNLRRDFFIRQLIRLPSNLPVGRFFLKVRVTDLHSGIRDESTLPIILVADQRLVIQDTE